MTDRIHNPAIDKPARAIALKVAGVYAIVTTVWILGSGYVVLMLPAQVARYVEIYKGLGFSVVTTVLLYVAIHGWAVRFANQSRVADVAEHRLLQVIKAVPAGVMLTDARGIIEFANPEAELILGASSASMTGRHVEDVVFLPEDPSARAMELLDSGRMHGIAIRGAGDSSGHAFVATAARLETVSDQSGWVLAFTDVTGSHRETQHVRKLIRGYRVISDALKQIQTACDTQQLLSSVCDTLIEDGLISGVWAAVPGPEIGSYATVVREGVTDEMIERIESLTLDRPRARGHAAMSALVGGDLYVINDVLGEVDSPFQGLDSQSVPFGSSATFKVTAQGAPLVVMTLFAADTGYFDAEQVRLVSILHDAIVFAVSKFGLEAKRLAAEESLAISESAYRQMFKQSPEPMWVYDRSSLAFLAVNDAAIRKYGYSAEEFAAMTIIDIRPPEDIPRLLHSVAHHTSGQEDAGYWTHIDKAGHTFAVYVQSNSITWNGVEAQLVLVQEVATVG